MFILVKQGLKLKRNEVLAIRQEQMDAEQRLRELAVDTAQCQGDACGLQYALTETVGDNGLLSVAVRKNGVKLFGLWLEQVRDVG